MPSNKDRLYIGLYARGGKSKMPGKEDTYHWALIIGPKVENYNDKDKKAATKYHAKERLDGWEFTEERISLQPVDALLVRILIAKIERKDRAVDIFRKIPIKPDELGWNCVSWVKEALAALQTDGRALGTGNVDWKVIRDAAMSYVEKKKEEHRFDGKGDYDSSRAPTWDILEGRETIAHMDILSTSSIQTTPSKQRVDINNSHLRRFLLLVRVRLYSRNLPPHGPILMLSNDLCVKIGNLKSPTEAPMLQFVARNTSITVPKVHLPFERNENVPCGGQVARKDNATRLIRSKSKAKENILARLKGMVDQLRRIPTPPGHLISNVAGGPLFDGRLAQGS
ncbi:hypothetical protein VTL71DRAFT_11357 [Oculimacula yallundae]|uniref:Uncharacterized protein n=1 Tax=Oculimacula yallundae TaxID=86028 RepID=A0ABR4CQA7_9HELO